MTPRSVAEVSRSAPPYVPKAVRAPSMITMSFMDGSRAATPRPSIVPLVTRLSGDGLCDQRGHFVGGLNTCLHALDPSALQALADRGIDRLRRLVLAEMIEQQRQRADRGDRTRDALARIFRRAPVDRLENRDLPGVDVARRRRAETAGEGGAEVREDVAEEIRRDHDVELLRLEHHPHRGGVDVHRIPPNIRELLTELLEDVAPDLLDRDRVRLVDQRDALLPVLA